MRGINYKNLMLLSLIYLLSQGMLLLVTGRWWDDWVFYKLPYSSLCDEAMQLGRPSLIFIIEFAGLFSEPGYRVITFFMFYFCMLFLYNVLKIWLKIDEQECFWICALYAIIPVNDSRIMLAVFPYTVGYFFFMMGLYYFSRALFSDNFDKMQRVVSCIIFLCSFTLNSCLVFYGLVIFMIISKERSVFGLVNYKEFVILPLIFFICKNIFFPAYGLYEGYNAVTVYNLVKGMVLILPSDIFVLINIIFNFAFRNYYILLLIYIIIGLFLDFDEIKKVKIKIKQTNIIDWCHSINCNKNVILLCLGMLSLSLALFPYVAVRGWKIATYGVAGRDSILVALGGALCLYGLCRLFIKKHMQQKFLLGITLFGILVFNYNYFTYQSNYYQQLGFQYQLSQHTDLSKTKNLVCINQSQDGLHLERFYTLNANAEEVFGKQDKLIALNFEDYKNMVNDNLSPYIENKQYHISDYDASNKHLDAVIEYSMPLNKVDAIELKLYELLGSEMFKEEIINRSSMVVYFEGMQSYSNYFNAP